METEHPRDGAGDRFLLARPFRPRDPDVKIVMLMLMIMSFWSWAIIIQKHIMYRAARAEAAVFDRAFWSGEPLDELYEKIGPEPQGASEKVFAAGMLEWRRSHKQDGGLIAGAQARIDRAMDVAIARESEKLNKGLSFLATVGSTAPFIGLFGTVWGIKHSLRADRDQPEHQPCRRGPRHRRGAAWPPAWAWSRPFRPWCSTTS
jgi:biopolymer transport protein TolQ